jgi:hypothetical protein
MASKIQIQKSARYKAKTFFLISQEQWHIIKRDAGCRYTSISNADVRVILVEIVLIAFSHNQLNFH